MTADAVTTLPDGQEVRRITLRSRSMTAQLLTLGAIVQDLRIEGVDHPLVLGCDDIADYLGQARYMGAIVGRFANRIARALSAGRRDLPNRSEFSGPPHAAWRI